MEQPDLVLMGRAAGAFGVRGELRVFSFAEDDALFAAGGVLWAGANPESARPLTMVSVRPHAGRLLFTCRELTSREEAEALKGAFVYLPASVLPALGADEYYWYQLTGLMVAGEDGEPLGRVAGVASFGAQETWLVRDQRGRELLVPILEGVIRELDLKRKRAVLRLPEGLLEAQQLGGPGPDRPAGT